MTPNSSSPLDGSQGDPSASADHGESDEAYGAITDGTLEDGRPECDEPQPVETESGLVDVDIQNRLWIKALVPLLQLRAQEADPSERVQFALDRMYIAACERAARIF